MTTEKLAEEWCEAYRVAIEFAAEIAFNQQLWTRKGSRSRGQAPLADESQSKIWLKARDFLKESQRPYPPSGIIIDG